MLATLLKGMEEVGILALRFMVGLTFMAHGSQKLFGMFGGPGIEGTAKFFAMIHIEPSLPMAILSGCGEFFGGLALVLGLFTRYAAVVLTINMIVAIATVHWPKGFFLGNGGYEYNLVLISSFIYFFFNGPGKYSFEKKLFGKEILFP